MTKYYIDSNGNYLGGFSAKNNKIPKDAVEVASPPSDAKYAKWDNNSNDWGVDDTKYLNSLKETYTLTRKNYLQATLDEYLNHVSDHLANGTTYGNSLTTQRATANSQIADIATTTTLAEFNALNLTKQFP